MPQYFTGAEYLKMDVAGKFGLDKEDWNVRLNWFEENKDNLLDFYDKADEPAGYIAGCLAYEKASKGIPTGYTISLDATSSGIQILACFAGCEESAKLCNLINTGKREDAYTLLYNDMKEKLHQEAGLERKQVKNAVITSIYGSQAEPRDTFGDGTKELDQFYETMERKLPGVWEINQAMINLWQPNALSHNFTMPDGFEVKLKVIDKIQHKVHLLGKPYIVEKYINTSKKFEVSLGANITHPTDALIVREIQRRCTYDISLVENYFNLEGNTNKSFTRTIDKQLLRLIDLYRRTKFMSIRILQYIDDKNYGLLLKEHKSELDKIVKQMIEHKPFEVLSIHDCFRCLASYGNYLRKHFNYIMHQIARSTILDSIASQITGNKVVINKLGDISQAILDSDYGIC